MTEESLVNELSLGEGQGNHIVEAVVFIDQAYLKRQAQMHVEAGLNRILMELQAFSVDRDSAQAKVYGQGEIVSVQYKTIRVKEAPQKDRRALELKKDECLQAHKALKNQRETVSKQQRFLDSVIGFADTEMPKKIKSQFPKTEDLQTMLEFLDTSFSELAERDRTLEQQIQDLDRELAVLESKLKRLRRPKEHTRKVIEVLFQSHKAHEIGVEVAYVAQHASWEPIYKVDIPLDCSQVNLTLFAQIQQQTGEHWQEVKLSVSNTIPLKGAALPELNSWYLQLAPPQPPMAATALMAGAVQRSRQDFAAAEEEIVLDLEEEPEAVFSQAEEKALPHAFEYELLQAVNIDSVSGETILPLYTKNMSGEFFIYAVPRQDPLVYLVCCAAADSTLLAGKLNIYFGGRFVSSAALAEKQAGEDLLVNLGAERGVKVRRQQISDKVTETFFGMVDRSSVARELQYRIVIENLKEETVKVRVLDSIPVSKTDKVQIKGVETIPEPSVSDYKKREGVMRWDLSLKPKEVREITVKFFVKHPKNQVPGGLYLPIQGAQD